MNTTCFCIWLQTVKCLWNKKYSRFKSFRARFQQKYFYLKIILSKELWYTICSKLWKFPSEKDSLKLFIRLFCLITLKLNSQKFLRLDFSLLMNKMSKSSLKTKFTNTSKKKGKLTCILIFKSMSCLSILDQ